MTNGRRIVVARPGDPMARMAPCRLCQSLKPAEQLSPKGICTECWAREGAPRGWTLIPDGMALVPAQVVQQAKFGGAVVAELEEVCRETGAEEPPFLALLRLIEERERLDAALDDREIPARCCYCHTLVDLNSEEEEREQQPLTTHRLVTLWACTDRDVCLARINAQIGARQQQVRARRGH